ncbi:MAG: YdcF family protein [Ginsengibacter sp.]
MFFVLSKLITFLLSPIFWIVLFFAIGYFTRRKRLKKISYGISLATFLLFSNPFLLDRFARWWDAKETTLPPGGKYSCAIVLGGFVSEDYHGHGYFNSTSDRFIQLIKLKAEGKVSHLLISGGNAKLLPTDFRESDWVATQLKDFNIPDSDIIIENRSRNSYENAVFSKKLLDSAHLSPPFILVTSGYHMRRALATYKKMGVDVIPYPCNYIAGKGKTEIEDFVPSLSSLGTWYYYIKELVGYAVYSFKKK